MVSNEYAELGDMVDDLVHVCYHESLQAGWWHDPVTGKSTKENPLTFSNKLCLIHSEISEAMEADRKGLMDDKLPHLDGRAVELADAVIRICDLAGAYDLDLGRALAEKLEYNSRRPDHKLENRLAAGGKVY